MHVALKVISPVVLLLCLWLASATVYGEPAVRIEDIATLDIRGTPRDEFLPGDRMLVRVRCRILEDLGGPVAVHLRAFGQGYKETLTQSVPGGRGERIAIFGYDPPLRLSPLAADGKITLSIQLASPAGVAQAEGKAHVYIHSSCALGNFPRTYLGYAPVSMQPYDMAFSRDDRFVYVTSNEARNITVVDTARLAVSRIIEDLDNIGLPRRIALNRDGSAMLAADYAMGKVHVISTATQQWQRGIAVTNRKGLLGIAFNVVRGELYLTDFAYASLIVCNGSSYTLEHEIPLVDIGRGLYGFNPFDLRIDPSGVWAYVYCQLLGQVVKVDLRSRSVVTWNSDVAAESWGVDMSPDGSRFYVIYPDVITGGSRLYVVSTADMSLSTIYELGYMLWDLVVRPDGRYGYAVDSYRGEVVVIDLATGDVLQGCSVPIGYGGKIIRPNQAWTRLFVGSWTQPYIYAVGW